MVYWDRVVVLNGIVDYLLLLSAAWLSGLPLRRGRLVLWAALGGLYCCEDGNKKRSNILDADTRPSFVLTNSAVFLI